MDARLRAVLVGAATGSRSSYGMAAVALSAPAPSAGTPIPEHALGSTPGRVVAALAAVGETVADKLPQTPSRLDLPGLPLRALAGAASGALVARRHAASPALPAGLGAAAAVGTSYAGAWFRSAVARRFGHDAWGAVIEDGVAAVLAFVAVRRPATVPAGPRPPVDVSSASRPGP